MRHYCDENVFPRNWLRRRIENRAPGLEQPKVAGGMPLPPGSLLQSLGGTIFASRNVYQTIADGVHHEFGGFVNAQRVHDIGAMYGDSVGTEVKLRRNLFV